jgi:acyl-CoA thioesterase FadM
VELGVAKVGTSSITWTWRVLHDASVATTGSHTVAHVDVSGRPAPIPERLPSTLDAHLDVESHEPDH